MDITSSYKVQFVGLNHIFKETVTVYRKALSFLIGVFNQEWESLETIDKAKSRFNYAERLVHSTSKNSAKHDFDKRFYKMPSYLRRAVIQAALGCVSSYKSNLANWEVTPVGKKPVLQADRYAMPCFYNDNMYKESSEPNKAWLKLYRNNDWVWVQVNLRAQDVKYLKKYWNHCKASAPTLEKHHKKYCLRFAFGENVNLSSAPVQDARICSVDLGLNTDAVCSIMHADGTILARKFISFASEKDHLSHTLNKIKKKQRKNGSKSVTKIWEYAKRCNNEHAIKVAAAITEFAILYSVDTIVFEYLDFKGKRGKGSKAQKLAMWRKNGIQDYVEHKAHRCGIRISRICAWNTSALAYDGSGKLKRNNKNHALATFANGKQYNCDLSASYNIGARYFMRELLKSLSEKVRSRILAEVPECEKRTQSTWSTLISLNVVINSLTAA